MQYLRTYDINVKEEKEFDTTGKPIKDYESVDATTISKLERLGFTGIDLSLEISLLEYGMAWVKKGSDWHFIHKHTFSFHGFDHSTFPVDTDWRSEFSWMLDDLNSFLSYIDMTEEEFEAVDFPVKVFDLVGYWGVENVFGTSYTGFIIFADGKNRRQEYLEMCGVGQ